jgi:hypothetical protein
LKTKKNGKIGVETNKIFGTNIIKRKENLLAFRKQKNGKIGQKNPKNLLILK